MFNIVTGSILAMFAGFILLDTFWRPREYPSTPGWRLLEKYAPEVLAA